MTGRGGLHPVAESERNVVAKTAQLVVIRAGFQIHLRPAGFFHAASEFSEEAGIEQQLEYRRQVLVACEQTMERLADDPHYFSRPERALFQDIRRYFPITNQAQVGWTVEKLASIVTQESMIGTARLEGAAAR